jgi:hypothetical protein
MKPGRSISLVSTIVLATTIAFAAPASPQKPPNFSGTWVLSTARSKNLGMMATLKDTVAISQTSRELTVLDTSSFQGQTNTREIRYDLTGKTVSNEGPMGDHNETVARWVGNKLVTTWTKEGAVAGTKSVMTETRSVSSDGRTMTLESVRGENTPIVMIFEKQ